jgi:signal peptidase I
MEQLILSQKLRGKRNERIPIKAGLERSYARAIKVHNDKIKSQEENGDEIAIMLSKINTQLPNYPNDTNPNQVDFINRLLYTKDEIKVYYSQSEFNLKELIYDWVKQLVLVIHRFK